MLSLHAANGITQDVDALDQQPAAAIVQIDGEEVRAAGYAHAASSAWPASLPGYTPPPDDGRSRRDTGAVGRWSPRSGGPAAGFGRVPAGPARSGAARFAPKPS
ncbi:MAG: hypothetical protein U5K33_09320 [Halofilum sp. (in: g-proteobacteria)]|nr:hypothetical protein [Halofilum sp. (in: g-proteobacteria)]